MASIDTPVTTALAAGGLGLAEATNLFRGPPRDGDGIASTSVFATATGGPPPVDYIDGGSGASLKTKTCLVTVRSAKDTFATGQALAESCWSVLHKATPSGWISFDVRESAPNYLGIDDSGRHLWTFNVEGMISE
jgi:hypothetical protein